MKSCCALKKIKSSFIYRLPHLLFAEKKMLLNSVFKVVCCFYLGNFFCFYLVNYSR